MVERVFNKQALAHSVETPYVFLSFCPKRYLNVNFDDTVEGKNKDGTVLDTVKGNPGSNGPKTKEKERKKKASHHHVTTSTMGCSTSFSGLFFFFQSTKSFHAVFDKSYNLSVWRF